MKERPILFSTPMVRAILGGDKKQTRRIAKPVRHPDLGNVYAPGALVLEREPQHVIERACPYGRPGDQLWVRETWGYNPDHPGMAWHACYRADQGHEHDGIKWKPSIHMPRAACRIKLEITSVRVERLQDISEQDALAEGIEKNWTGDPGKGQNGFGTVGWIPDCGWINYMEDMDGEPAYTPEDSFRSLWQSINGRDSWDANPWVWIIEFRRVE